MWDKFIQVTANNTCAIFGLQETNYRYLLLTTSRSVLYVVFRATLAGDVAQVDFVCRNFHLNMCTELTLLLIKML